VGAVSNNLALLQPHRTLRTPELMQGASQLPVALCIDLRARRSTNSSVSVKLGAVTLGIFLAADVGVFQG
jgi:hypothetical protein